MIWSSPPKSVRGRDPSGAWLPWATPGQLRGQVEENLRQLGRDHLDLVNLRAYPTDSIAEHFGALAELRDAGLIRQLGISSVRPAHLAQAQAIAPVVCVQNRYSIDTHSRDADDFLRGCGEQGIAFVPYFAIAGEGREAGAGGTEHDEVLAIALAHGAAPHRCGWPGRCSRGRMCWPSRASATRTTSPRTWRPACCGSRREKWTVSGRSAIRGRKPRGRPHRAATPGRPSPPAAGAPLPRPVIPGPGGQPGAGEHLRPRVRAAPLPTGRRRAADG